MSLVGLFVGVLCGVIAARALSERWRGCRADGRIFAAAMIVGAFGAPFAFFGLAVGGFLVALLIWILAAGVTYGVAAAFIAFAEDRRRQPPV